MKIVSIFDTLKPTLYSIHFDEEVQDEYHRLLEFWNDPEYLLNFFTKNQNDLKYYSIDINGAAIETYKLAKRLEESVVDASENHTLQILFKPLNNFETSINIEHQKTKAKRKWLRMYAIRIGHNCFVITGGAIKLTREMKERAHTRKELHKIDKVKDFLQANGLYDPEDFDLLEL